MEKLIPEALQAFGMADAQYELIRHNENITCKVMHQGASYALRIHCPVEGFRPSFVAGERSDLELFQSETALLHYMEQNGFSGLQKPVAGPFGAYVAVLGNGAPAMMLSYVEGHPVTAEEGPKLAREIGRLACRISRAAKGFAGERPRFDCELSDRMKEEIEKAVALKHITEDEGRDCIREIEAVKELQIRLAKRRPPSVIHADLSFNNILVTDSGLVPIDFSLSGYASLEQEAGMLLSNYQDEESIAELLSGFSDEGELIERADAEVFLSYSVLLFICAQHDRYYQEEWFIGAMKHWCETLFVHGHS